MTSALLRIAEYVVKTTTLGPGLRFALWTQGCPHSCPACVSAEFIPLMGGRLVRVDELVEAVRATPSIEGVTISGGEPFLQSVGVGEFAQRVREEMALSVIVYTGYRIDELVGLARRKPGVGRLIRFCDVLIDGRYEHEKNNSLGLRGSSNQNVHFLTPRYRAQRALFESSERRLETHEIEGGTLTVGVPPIDVWRGFIPITAEAGT